MKKHIKILFILLIVALSTVSFSKKTKAQQPYVSFQVFYDQLSPYGQWVDYPQYGYVWIPNAGHDFVPYSTRGYWILTEYGWTWYSDYNWGWAPFHYGRWDYDSYYGWFWLPDNEWGPSLVIWRQAEGYYGWAPMRPGITINVSFGNDYNSHNDHWVFVRDKDFGKSNIHKYYVNRNDHDRIIRNSRVINNTFDDRGRNTKYVAGPDRNDVQKVTGRKNRTVAVQDNNNPGHKLKGDQLEIYRPKVNNQENTERRSAPSKVYNKNEVKQPAQRNGTKQQQNIKGTDNNKQNQNNQPQTEKQSKNNKNKETNKSESERGKKR